MAEAIFYVVEIDPPPSVLPAFAAWYAAAHAPHLFNAGFNNCTSYVAVSGTMPVVDIYQAADWSMFESPAFERYRPIAIADPYRPDPIRGVRNSRTVYHHHAATPLCAGDAATPLPAGDAGAPLDADWLMIWRFAGDAALEARVADWLAAGGAAVIGAAQTRLLHRGPDAPTGGSVRPALALVTEWATRPPGLAALRASLPDWLAAALDPDQEFCGWRLYPWANDPQLRLATAPAASGEIHAR